MVILNHIAGVVNSCTQKGVNVIMENIKIRVAAKDNGVCLWEVAEVLGIPDASFSRKLRRELPEQKQKEILNIIADIADKRGVNDGE